MEVRLKKIKEKEEQIMFNKSKESWDIIISNLEMSKDYDDEEDLLLNLYDPNESLPDIESSLHLKLNLPPNPNNPNKPLPLPDWNNFVEIFEDWQIELKKIYEMEAAFHPNFLRFSIQQQEKHYNDIINDCNKFKAEHPELNSCDASKRFIFTNICQYFPIFLKYLLAIGAIRVYPNNFTYYNVYKNRFCNRDKCFASINRKIDFINFVFQCFDAFSDCFGLLWNSLNANETAEKNVDAEIKKLKRENIKISPALRSKMIKKRISEIYKEIPKKIEEDTGIKFTSIKVKNMLIFTDERTERISICINKGITTHLEIKIHGDDGERSFLSQIYLFENNEESKLSKFLATFAQFKKDFTEHILAFENYVVAPITFLNPRFKSTICIIKDHEEAPTAYSITCNLISTILAGLCPDSFKYINNNFGAHELNINIGISDAYCEHNIFDNSNLRNKFDFKGVFEDLYEFYEQINVLNKEYIEEGIKDGKKIYRVYSGFIFTKDHIPKLFLLISMLSNIDKVLAESKEELLESESEIAYLKKWPNIFKKLPEEIQRKYINFATKSGFDNSMFCDIDSIQFYEILTKDYGFTNIEFFILNLALEHLGKLFNTSGIGFFCKQINDYFEWALNGFKTSEVPNDKNKLFDDVIQYFPNYFVDFSDMLNHRNKDIDFAILDVNTNEITTISKAIDKTIYDDCKPNRIIANKTKIVVAEGPQQILMENPASIPQLAPTPTHHLHDTI